jgi:hypothetical protein
MRKIMLSVAMIATSFTFAQINLEHSFADNEDVFVYTKENTTLYVTKTIDNKIKIYDSNYTLQKTVNVPIPSTYGMFYSGHFGENPFFMSKNVFNNDNNYEFMVEVYQMGTSTTPMIFKTILIDENGNLIKDFHPNPSIKQSAENFEVYHDNISNMNKLIVRNQVNGQPINQYDVYSLPTSQLTLKEVQSKTKLSAFPIPTNKILNIINPENGNNTVSVYDMSGKLVLSKSFGSSESKISIDVENLTKGIYIYKIGELSSKFIKN